MATGEMDLSTHSFGGFEKFAFLNSENDSYFLVAMYSAVNF